MKNVLFFITILALFTIACSGIGRKPAIDSSLDTDSKECLTCHLGERATFNAKIGGSHAPHEAGLDYRSLSEKTPTLTNVDMLAGELTLVDGRISCITCHTVYDKSAHDGKMLTVSNARSALCMKCHNK
jgi:hypothetical protein